MRREILIPDLRQLSVLCQSSTRLGPQQRQSNGLLALPLENGRAPAALLRTNTQPPWLARVLHSARKPLNRNGPKMLSFTPNALFSQREKLTLNQRVQGSNPCTPTNDINNLAGRSNEQGGPVFGFGRKFGHNRNRWET